MKHTKFLLMSILILVGISMLAFPPEANAQVSHHNTVIKAIAYDSTLVNSDTSYSAPITVFAKNDDIAKDVNFLLESYVTIMSNQKNDSVHALIYINSGQITNGVLGVDYIQAFADSLTSSHMSTIIDVGKYMTQPQLQIVVISYSTGNGAEATWSASFGGAGYSILKQ